MCRRIIVLTLTLALAAFSFVALAQKEEPPKCDPEKEKCGCSPGYYKNHTETWFGLGCSTQYTDAQLLAALECRGSDASCGRSAAAAILDECTGCVED